MPQKRFIEVIWNEFINLYPYNMVAFHQDSFPPRSTMHRVSISLSVCV